MNNDGGTSSCNLINTGRENKAGIAAIGASSTILSTRYSSNENKNVGRNLNYDSSTQSDLDNGENVNVSVNVNVNEYDIPPISTKQVQLGGKKVQV